MDEVWVVSVLRRVLGGLGFFESEIVGMSTIPVYILCLHYIGLSFSTINLILIIFLYLTLKK